jgi:dienelactone hydrolase
MAMAVVLVSGFAAAGAPAAAEPALDVPPGKVTDAIQCTVGMKKGDKAQWSYHLYLPTTFAPGRKWPVMFVFDPGGGKAATLNRYIKGAEMNGMILAVSVQSSNKFNDSATAALAMVADVKARLPVDPGRIYFSGFSGGAREAFDMAGIEKGTAGLLPCGAGTGHGRLPNFRKVTVYGLSGTACFNRWDMACVMKGVTVQNRDSRLRFFIGKHDWAGEMQIRDGMTWLNICYLKRQGVSGVTKEEREGLGERLLKLAGEEKEKNPEHAQELAAMLALLPGCGKAQQQGAAMAAELLKNSVVAQNVKACAAAEKFALTYYVTQYGSQASQHPDTNVSPKLQAEAAKLVKQFAGTSMEPILQALGEKSVTF